MSDDNYTTPDTPAVLIVGSRFAIQAHAKPDKPVHWYDSNDTDVRKALLQQERSSLVWEGASSLGVRVAAELRAAGLLEEPPLDLTKYVEELRRLSDELGGEYLPDAIRRIMAELAKLGRRV